MTGLIDRLLGKFGYARLARGISGANYARPLAPWAGGGGSGKATTSQSFGGGGGGRGAYIGQVAK